MGGNIISAQNGENFIKFTTVIDFVAQKWAMPLGDSIELPSAGEFRFSCNYKADYAAQDSQYTLKALVCRLS